MKRLQQFRKILLLICGILLMVGGIVTTIIAIKMDKIPQIKDGELEELLD